MKITAGFDPRDPEHLQLYIEGRYDDDLDVPLVVDVPVDEARPLARQIQLLMLSVDVARKETSS